MSSISSWSADEVIQWLKRDLQLEDGIINIFRQYPSPIDGVTIVELNEDELKQLCLSPSTDGSSPENSSREKANQIAKKIRLNVLKLTHLENHPEAYVANSKSTSSSTRSKEDKNTTLGTANSSSMNDIPSEILDLLKNDDCENVNMDGDPDGSMNDKDTCEKDTESRLLIVIQECERKRKKEAETSGEPYDPDKFRELLKSKLAKYLKKFNIQRAKHLKELKSLACQRRYDKIGRKAAISDRIRKRLDEEDPEIKETNANLDKLIQTYHNEDLELDRYRRQLQETADCYHYQREVDIESHKLYLQSQQMAYHKENLLVSLYSRRQYTNKYLVHFKEKLKEGDDEYGAREKPVVLPAGTSGDPETTDQNSDDSSDGNISPSRSDSDTENVTDKPNPQPYSIFVDKYQKSPKAAKEHPEVFKTRQEIINLTRAYADLESELDIYRGKLERREYAIAEYQRRQEFADNFLNRLQAMALQQHKYKSANGMLVTEGEIERLQISLQNRAAEFTKKNDELITARQKEQQLLDRYQELMKTYQAMMEKPNSVVKAGGNAMGGNVPNGGGNALTGCSSNADSPLGNPAYSPQIPVVIHPVFGVNTQSEYDSDLMVSEIDGGAMQTEYHSMRSGYRDTQHRDRDTQHRDTTHMRIDHLPAPSQPGSRAGSALHATNSLAGLIIAERASQSLRAPEPVPCREMDIQTDLEMIPNPNRDVSKLKKALRIFANAAGATTGSITGLSAPALAVEGSTSTAGNAGTKLNGIPTGQRFGVDTTPTIGSRGSATLPERSLREAVARRSATDTLKSAAESTPVPRRNSSTGRMNSLAGRTRDRNSSVQGRDSHGSARKPLSARGSNPRTSNTSHKALTRTALNSVPMGQTGPREGRLSLGLDRNAGTAAVPEKKRQVQR